MCFFRPPRGWTYAVASLVQRWEYHRAPAGRTARLALADSPKIYDALYLEQKLKAKAKS